MSDEQITIPKLTAQVLFDALVGSMDFGSGFLDSEEVEALRGLAVALGVDPKVATPSEFVSQYEHTFAPMPPEMIPNVFTPHVAVRCGGSGGGIEIWTTERQGQLPDFTPCKVGAWGRMCRKPESDPIHQAAEDARMSA